MKIPYGNADFANIRREGAFYVDKTPFLATLERSDLKNLVFLRPRRMGKSSLLSMMAHYYDIARADQFDELFGGLWVHEHPTPKKNAYLVLHINLGSVRGSDEEAVKHGFGVALRDTIKKTLPRYFAYGPEFGKLHERLDDLSDPIELLSEMTSVAASIGKALYVLIDEYDTFANGLIAAGSKNVYGSLTEHTGFIRNFYAALKAGSETGGIARIFVTGVSPILLDDLYTGFNIATNITTDPRFNALAGFTHADVERGLDELLAGRPSLAEDPRVGDRATLVAVLERYYNGYRFSYDASQRVFNSDMVLYFLKQLDDAGTYPRKMLDPNARTDYQKFYGLFQSMGQSAQERREVLETVLNEGGVSGELLETFGRTPPSPSREQFISLLFYTGMLTLSAEPPIGWMTRFEIPNLVIRNLQWEHFSAILKETTGIEMLVPAIATAQRGMAVQGDIAPFVEALHEHVMKVLGLKDLMHFDEKAIKMILITSAIMSGIFHVLSEKEFAQGFCDLFMSPKFDVHDAKYSWLIELKYLPTKATEGQIRKALAEATGQLDKYAADKELVPMLTKHHALKAVALVFVGAKEIRFRPWPGDVVTKAPAQQATTKKATTKKPAAKKAAAKKRSR